jgi:hypothetical protein
VDALADEGLDALGLGLELFDVAEVVLPRPFSKQLKLEALKMACKESRSGGSEGRGLAGL